MSRDLPTGFAAQTEATVFRPAFLLDLDWPSGMVYFWTGFGSISWNGHTYVGTGQFGTISLMSESKDGRANGVTLSLNGIPSSLIPDILANDAQGRSAKVWIAPLNADRTFAADPYCIKDAVVDVTPVEDNGTTANVSVQLENELIDRRLHNRRNNHEDQQIDSPGDDIFQYVAALANREFTWGGKTTSPVTQTESTSSGPGGKFDDNNSFDPSII